MKHLFVSFAHCSGHGNAVVEIKDGEEIKGVGDIREIAQKVSVAQDGGKTLTGVIILNFQWLPY